MTYFYHASRTKRCLLFLIFIFRCSVAFRFVRCTLSQNKTARLHIAKNESIRCINLMFNFFFFCWKGFIAHFLKFGILRILKMENKLYSREPTLTSFVVSNKRRLLWAAVIPLSPFLWTFLWGAHSAGTVQNFLLHIHLIPNSSLWAGHMDNLWWLSFISNISLTRKMYRYVTLGQTN